jgi:predicted nucleotidyltransferase
VVGVVGVEQGFIHEEVVRPCMSQPGAEIPADVREEVVTRLREAPVTLAVLFGSHATGDATTGSDIDIAVAYDTDDPTETHFSLVADLTQIFGRDDIDVVRLHSVDPRIAVDALTHGEILVGSADDAAQLRDRLEDDRQQRESEVSNRIADAERAIERRIDHREHG